jgi:hypothetical protein
MLEIYVCATYESKISTKEQMASDKQTIGATAHASMLDLDMKNEHLSDRFWASSGSEQRKFREIPM